MSVEDSRTDRTQIRSEICDAPVDLEVDDDQQEVDDIIRERALEPLPLQGPTVDITTLILDGAAHTDRLVRDLHDCLVKVHARRLLNTEQQREAATALADEIIDSTTKALIPDSHAAVMVYLECSNLVRQFVEGLPVVPSPE